MSSHNVVGKISRSSLRYERNHRNDHIKELRSIGALHLHARWVHTAIIIIFTTLVLLTYTLLVEDRVFNCIDKPNWPLYLRHMIDNSIQRLKSFKNVSIVKAINILKYDYIIPLYLKEVDYFIQILVKIGYRRFLQGYCGRASR